MELPVIMSGDDLITVGDTGGTVIYNITCNIIYIFKYIIYIAVQGSTVYIIKVDYYK